MVVLQGLLRVTSLAMPQVLASGVCIARLVTSLLTYYVQIELSVREHKAILAWIIEIKVSQSELMLILELVRGSQTIRCPGLRVVKM